MSQNADSHPEPQPTLTTLESMETTLESIVQESTINNQEVTHITEAENTLEQVEEIQTIPELRNRKRSSYSHVYPKEPKETVNEQKDTPNTKDEVIFECNICLDTASNPVVTMCGHLYCWPCLNNWLKSGSPASNTCPVCKSGTSRESVIPIYCRGQDIKDPRNQPDETRPSGQRTNVPPIRSGFGNMFNIQFGFTPFGVNIGVQREFDDSSLFASRIMLMLGTLLLVTIILY